MYPLLSSQLSRKYEEKKLLKMFKTIHSFKKLAKSLRNVYLGLDVYISASKYHFKLVFKTIHCILSSKYNMIIIATRMIFQRPVRNLYRLFFYIHDSLLLKTSYQIINKAIKSSLLSHRLWVTLYKSFFFISLPR